MKYLHALSLAVIVGGGILSLAVCLGFCWLFRLPEVRLMMKEFRSLRKPLAQS